MPKFSDRLKHAWNAFNGRDRPINIRELGPPTSARIDKPRRRFGTEKTIVAAIYNRIAIDVSAIGLRHVRLDENGIFIEYVRDGLDNILTTEANIDQTGRSFIRDLVLSMLEDGHIAAVPIDTSINPWYSGSYDIETMRRGKIIEWMPKFVKIEAYNEKSGRREELVVPKRNVAIIENPFYSVMNEPNSTLQRLIRKLSLLDAVDEQSGSGKLDMIIQLPYVIKTESRRIEAEKRREEIEKQLNNSKLGIAYTDGTERIVQLNRTLENNLMGQIEYLTKMLYSQLGITETILDGTADERTMLNYINRTIEPILDAIAEEFKRKFLTKTARTQGHSIKYFRDHFKLTTLSDMANIADVLSRDEILSSNEMRAVLGYRPSDDERADMLMNKNRRPDDMGEEQQMLPEGQEQEMMPQEQQVMPEEQVAPEEQY